MGLFGKAKQKDANVARLTALLDKFEYPHLEKLCTDVIKKSPQMMKDERMERTEYLEFIWGQYQKGIVSFQQVMDFATSEGIVSKDFFD
ncbi:MAG TPA: hypothetical protein VJ771_02615 [Candidatus Nitrosotalea sp.]|nr:hypothetical protein [Candidatus Nitrosotalea sp.]